MDKENFNYTEDFSLVNYISQYLPVNVYDSKTLGKRAICSCPFCDKGGINTLIISDKENKFNCFSCKKSGDGIDFIMKLKGYNIDKAMDDINKFQGIKSSYSEINKERNAELYIVNEIAKRSYYSNLKSNKVAYNYFRDRGITDKTMKKFQLGYSNYGIAEILKKQGYSDEVITDSGIGRIEDGNYKDKIFNRVMFPIMVNVNNQTKIVGFGGRVIKYPDDKNPNTPKYLNTSSSPVFDKSSTLYAFNFAEKSPKKGMILCEGYMDVIALHQADFDNAVASLGTAFTRNHALMIKEITDTVYLCYDNDEAGTKAKLKAIPTLKGAGLKVKVLDCSPYKDPDELIKAEGKKRFQQVINKSKDSYVYEVEKLKETSENIEDFENKFVHMIYDLKESEYQKYLDAYEQVINSSIPDKEIKVIKKEEFNSSMDVNVGFDTLGDDLVKIDISKITEESNKVDVSLKETDMDDEINNSDITDSKEYTKEVIDEYEFDIGFDSL